MCAYVLKMSGGGDGGCMCKWRNASLLLILSLYPLPSYLHLLITHFGLVCAIFSRIASGVCECSRWEPDGAPLSTKPPPSTPVKVRVRQGRSTLCPHGTSYPPSCRARPCLASSDVACDLAWPLVWHCTTRPPCSCVGLDWAGLISLARRVHFTASESCGR